MSDNKITLHCPKCNASAFQATENPDLNKSFTCGNCGAKVQVRDLRTPTGKTLAEHATDIAREAFKGIKGFKPSK